MCIHYQLQSASTDYFVNAVYFSSLACSFFAVLFFFREMLATQVIVLFLSNPILEPCFDNSHSIFRSARWDFGFGYLCMFYHVMGPHNLFISNLVSLLAF
jgi:hypothetical protein